jgi:hypothetical protein
MGRFQLELIYLYFPPSSHQNIQIFDGTTEEKKGKLILLIQLTVLSSLTMLFYLFLSSIIVILKVF